MTSRETKLRARMLMATTRPHPCFVTLALTAFDWIATYLTQIIGGCPFLIDLGALGQMDFANALVIDFSYLAPIATTLWIAFQILSVLLSYGFTGYALHVVRKEPSGFGNLLDGFSVALRAVVLSIIRGVLTAAASVFFLVPGIIVMLQYRMSSVLLMDHPDWSPIRCLRESRKMMKGHKMDLLCLYLSFIGWIILCLFPGVSLLVRPYMAIAETIFYENLASVCYPRQPAEEV